MLFHTYGDKNNKAVVLIHGMLTPYQIWNRAAQFQPERGSLNAWLTAVARNAALNRARRSERPEDPLPEDAAGGTDDPEETLLRREQQEKLASLLKKLPGTEREILLRKYYYRQPAAQIAAELGLTERAVEGRLRRVRKKLQKQWGGEDT
jgi:RNA polymerase sigma-70 factor (ECF subfamily)